MENTYIGVQYVPPNYSLNFWNLHQRVKDNIPRSNNAIEIWNRRFSSIAESSKLPFINYKQTIKKNITILRSGLQKTNKQTTLAVNKIKR